MSDQSNFHQVVRCEVCAPKFNCWSDPICCLKKLLHSDQKQMLRRELDGTKSGTTTIGRLTFNKIVAQANFYADYHAAVEKVLAAYNDHPGKLNIAISELSAVQEKAKGLL